MSTSNFYIIGMIYELLGLSYWLQKDHKDIPFLLSYLLPKQIGCRASVAQICLGGLLGDARIAAQKVCGS